MNLNPKIPGPYTMAVANGSPIPGSWATPEEASAAADEAMDGLAPGEVLVVYGRMVVPFAGVRAVPAGAELKG